jgi:hypothetical protein
METEHFVAGHFFFFKFCTLRHQLRICQHYIEMKSLSVK